VSLYRRHILSIISVFFVVSGFFSWLSYEVTQGYINEAKKERVALLAEIVKNGLKSIMLEGRNREDFQRFLDGLAAEDIRSVRVFSEKGIVLNSTVPGEVGGQVDEQHVGIGALVGQPDAPARELGGHSLGVLHRRLLQAFKGRTRSIAEAGSHGGDVIDMGAALLAGEDGAVDGAGDLLVGGQDGRGAGTDESLVRGERGDVGVPDGVGE